MTLTWKTDKAGDALYDGDEYIGCIYPRDPYGGLRKGWRVLGPDFEVITDVEPDPRDLFGDVRIRARAFLEGTKAPLPTAEELLNMRNEEEK